MLQQARVFSHVTGPLSELFTGGIVMKRMGKWHVVEYLRQRYLRTGTVPAFETIRMDFSGFMEEIEMHEGIREFADLVIGRRRTG